MAESQIKVLEKRIDDLTDQLNKLCTGAAPIAGPLTINGDLTVMGSAAAEVFESSNPLKHRMYPAAADAKIYQDIFEARDGGAIEKLGRPTFDDHTFANKPWCDRSIIKYGGNDEADGNGAKVIIPPGYDTVWVRVLGERWTVIKASFLNGGEESLGLWAGGYRDTNCYCPDGTLSDSYSNAHQWVPIPAGRAGELALIAKSHTNNDFWLSGLAFSKNPWAHAVQSAVCYHWALNGGDKIVWDKKIWHWGNDLIAIISSKSNFKLQVPVVPSGRDKLLYLIEHNNSWNGCMHKEITVNDKPIERFMASYDNPFARHWNSKLYERYIATRIPKDLIPADARYLSVKIDMSMQDKNICVREIGTHDLDIPRVN